MKILIGYPPTESEKGTATLGQNRQFQWFTNPCLIFPVVPASAATLLKKNGHNVQWIDCIAEKINWKDFVKIIKKEKPDLFVFETKTPVVKIHWKIIDGLKEKFPDMKIVIMGDHVTSFPKETMENSKTDFVLTGGDFDFLLLELVDFLERILDSPIQYTFADWRPGDQEIYVSDIRKAKHVLGWEPKLSPNKGIIELFEWVVKNQNIIRQLLE